MSAVALVILLTSYGVSIDTHLRFHSLNECEAAAENVQKVRLALSTVGAAVVAVCVEGVIQ
jgi:hypothetical protein